MFTPGEKVLLGKSSTLNGKKEKERRGEYKGRKGGRGVRGKRLIKLIKQGSRLTKRGCNVP